MSKGTFPFEASWKVTTDFKLLPCDGLQHIPLLALDGNSHNLKKFGVIEVYSIISDGDAFKFSIMGYTFDRTLAEYCEIFGDAYCKPVITDNGELKSIYFILERIKNENLKKWFGD